MTDLRTGVYRHYKGGFYLVIGVAQHSDTGAHLVVYVSLSDNNRPGPRMHARPIEQWDEWVESSDGMTTTVQSRFTWVGITLPEVD